MNEKTGEEIFQERITIEDLSMENPEEIAELFLNATKRSTET